jgi:inner membrane protein
MPTLFSHPAVPIALGLAAGSKVIPPRLLLAGVVASVVPDLDVLSFRLDINYGSDMGHRGFTHSLVFALLLATLAAIWSHRLKARKSTAFLFILLATASHGLLDMITNGGKGVAFLWPFTSERFFFPAQVIAVAPLSVKRLFSPAGLPVLVTELQWVWLPSLLLVAAFYLERRLNSR